MPTTLAVDPSETLDSLIERVRAVNGTDEVVFALPENSVALQNLDEFNVLRTVVREKNLKATFRGGNRTTRGLAKILGFNVVEGATPFDAPATFSAATQPITRERTGAPQAAPSIQDTFGLGAAGFDFPNLEANLTPPAPPPGTQVTALGTRGQPQPRPQRDFDPPQTNTSANGGRVIAPGDDFVVTSSDFADGRSTARNGINPAPAAPRPFDTMPPREADAPGSRTLSYDEALRSGYLRNTTFDGPTAAPPTNGGYGLVEPDAGFEDGGSPDFADYPADGAGLSTGGRRIPTQFRDDVEEEAAPLQTATRLPRNRRAAAVGGGGVAALGGLAALLRARTPRQRPINTAAIATPPLDPAVIQSRDNERRQRTLPALLVALVLLLLTILLIFWTTGGFINQAGGGSILGSLVPPNATATATAPHATVHVAVTPPTISSQPVILVLQPGNSAAAGGTQATPGTAGANGTPTGANGTATTGGNGTPATGSALTTGATAGVLPVHSITKNGVSATGSLTPDKLYPITVGDKYAGGDLYVINGNNYALSYPAGAPVMTIKGITFVTTNAVTVPAARLDAGQTSSASFPVVANVKGTAGNVGSVGGFYAPGKPNLYIKPSQMSGGTDTTQYKVTDDNAKDLALIAQLKTAINSQVKNDFAAQSGSDQLAGDPTISNMKLTLDPAPGTVLDKPQAVKATLTADVTGYTYSQSDLNAAVAATLAQANGNGTLAITGAHFDSAPTFGTTNGKMTLTGPASATVPTPDMNALKDALSKALAGQPVAQAGDIVKSVVGAGMTVITSTDPTYSPANFPTDPSLITIDASAGSTTTPGASGTTAAPNGALTPQPTNAG